ncbi:hypothetical protein HU200_035708 [Digitaria exilis]|uniref:BTB domain-containing protein n=1 Tax=Digitaria exilis TaxID=1010633 RepID=A0A835ELA7_9POAL|nr:hypothetical protein HU200_035708 [Digitaria exilis]
MATSQRPLARTYSTCAREAARGGHVFKISRYSLHRGVGAGESIQSAAFVIGSFTFCVRFYPDGYSTSDDDADYVAAFLHLLTKNKRGVDVTFMVRDELFKAHKIVLAMRSPVFAAQFYGAMAAEDTRRRYIVVEDMHPQVFRALLQFIYTDAMPSMEDYCNDDERQEIVRHLLVAADSLDADNVAAALVLADEHHCSTLKEACVEFITSAKGINSTVVVPRQGSTSLKRVFPASFIDMLWKVSGCMHGCFQFVGISREGDV